MTMSGKKPSFIDRFRVELDGANAVVVLQRGETGLICGLAHETPAENPALRERFQRAVKNLAPGTEEAALSSALQTALKAERLRVTEMPEGDTQIVIRVDATTGRTVTKFSAVAGGVTPTETFQRELARKALETVRKAVLGSVEQLRDALRGDDAQAFINATPRHLAEDDILTFEALVGEARRSVRRAVGEGARAKVAGEARIGQAVRARGHPRPRYARPRAG
jgi:hypothetical protein